MCFRRRRHKKKIFCLQAFEEHRRSKNNKSQVEQGPQPAQGLQLQNIWELVALGAVCYCLQSQLFSSRRQSFTLSLANGFPLVFSVETCGRKESYDFRHLPLDVSLDKSEWCWSFIGQGQIKKEGRRLIVDAIVPSFLCNFLFCPFRCGGWLYFSLVRSGLSSTLWPQ